MPAGTQGDDHEVLMIGRQGRGGGETLCRENLNLRNLRTLDGQIRSPFHGLDRSGNIFLICLIFHDLLAVVFFCWVRSVWHGCCANDYLVLDLVRYGSCAIAAQHRSLNSAGCPL